MYHREIRKLLVPIDFPAHVVVEGLCDGVGFLRNAHGDVVLEAHFADVLHEALKIRNLHDAVATECLKLVVCELAFTDVSADDPGRIIG